MSRNARSHGLWDETAPAAPVTASLSGDIVADIAVVGAGFTGLCAALHLAQAGRRVVVLEADGIGHGGSGRNVGLINAGMWVMPDDLPGALGATYGERLLELLGSGPQTVMALIDRHGIECELERNGTLHCAVGAAGFAEITERARQWRKRAAPVKLLTAEETAARVGSDAYAGALWDRRAGTLQPLAYARGLALAAIANGAVIHTGSPVTACRREGGGWRLATGSGGSATAQWVAVATDAYSVGPWRSVRREQVYLPYFNLATRPLPPDIRATILPGKEGAWDTREILSSFRLDQAGRLVFGSVGALRNAGRAVHVAWAKRALSRLFPQLARIDFDHEWYGWIGMTKDALPRFHRFDEKIVGFSGYNGRGIAPGTVFGALLAKLILGQLAQEDLPLPVSALTAPALRPVKELYYEYGAQIAHFVKDRA